MYRGFDVRFSFEDDLTTQAWAAAAHEQKIDHDGYVQGAIAQFTDRRGTVNATDLKDHWFPQIKAEVFISHSHADEYTALQLSGALQKYFGITSFIDSSVWGYSDVLLKQIDNAFCQNKDSSTYSYDLRNRSTAHVHMMLSIALSQMMDRTECVIFLNTPRSISTEKVVGKAPSDSTPSPWIYGELAMTRLLRERPPERGLKRMVKGALEEAINFNYDVDLSNLISLSTTDWRSWVAKGKGKSAGSALDCLYELKNVSL